MRLLVRSRRPLYWGCTAGRVAQLGEHLLCKRVRPFQRFLPLFYVSMFSTISGNLLLARSKPRGCNCIGFWYSFGTDRFANCSEACRAGILSLVETATQVRV